MNLYLINAPIGKRLVLGRDKNDAMDRLERCHSRAFTLNDKEIIPYRGTPATLTDKKARYVNPQSPIILRCTRCGDLACATYELYCIKCVGTKIVKFNAKNNTLRIKQFNEKLNKQNPVL